MSFSSLKKGTYYYLGKVPTKKQLWKALCDRLRSLGMSEEEIAKIKPHFTFFYLNFIDVRVISIVESASFQSFVSAIFLKYFKGVNLFRKQNDYELLGEEVKEGDWNKDRFYAMKFSLSPADQGRITNFRTEIYDRINKELLARYNINIQRNRVVSPDGTDMIAVDEFGHEWYSTPSHSYGVGKFLPHCSIVNIRKLQTHNPDLYKNLIETDVVTGRQKYRRDVTDLLSMQTRNYIHATGKGVCPFPNQIDCGELESAHSVFKK